MLIYLYIFIQYHRSLIFCMFSDKFLHPHHIIPASKLVSALMEYTHYIILLSLNINKYIRMLIHRIFLQPQMCFLLISVLWCYSTYIVDTAGFSSLRIFAIRTCVLLAHIRTFVKKKTRGSHECDHGFLFSSLSTITSCPFRRRHRLALQECPL